MNTFVHRFISALVFAIALPALGQEKPGSVPVGVATPTTQVQAADSAPPADNVEVLRLQQEDLKAQQEMAEYTLLQAVFSFVGFLLLICTVRISLRAARAAEDASTTAREHFKAQHRPWLIPKLHSDCKCITLDANQWLVYTVDLENLSNLPVVDRRIYSEVIPYPVDHDFSTELDSLRSRAEKVLERPENPPLTGQGPFELSIDLVNQPYPVCALIGFVFYKSPLFPDVRFHTSFASYVWDPNSQTGTPTFSGAGEIMALKLNPLQVETQMT
jgi:hypothetical protein